MKKLITFLALILISVAVFSQPLIFKSEKIKVVNEAKQSTYEVVDETLITIDNGFVRIIYSAEDQDFTNFLMIGEAATEEEDGIKIRYRTLMDRDENKVLLAVIENSNTQEYTIAVFMEEVAVYYFGSFVEEGKSTNKYNGVNL